jgi:lipopolysaccharide/colanic/teichoic acid biosynthesis glycosyltransferase
VEKAEPGKASAVPVGTAPYPGKRLLDVVLGTVASVVTLPIIAVLATISAVKFRASPFFVQERVGMNGESFRCYKIRSLPKETPAYLDKTALNDHGHPKGWCKFLRRFHLDELPQFWHVVGGSMSLVGPRPMIASIIDDLSPQTARVRQSIRPGITGPWQVSVDGARSLHESLDYDQTYVREASLVLDLKLLALTAAQTLGLPKCDRPRVFAMMSTAPHVAGTGDQAVIELSHDHGLADVRAAS